MNKTPEQKIYELKQELADLFNIGDDNEKRFKMNTLISNTFDDIKNNEENEIRETINQRIEYYRDGNWDYDITNEQREIVTEVLEDIIKEEEL